MKDIVKLCVSLGLVCAIGCAALVWVDRLTEEPRKLVRESVLTDSMKMVLPYGMEGVFAEALNITAEDVVFHRLMQDGRVAAVVAESSGKGFGGVMKVLVGIDVAAGKIVRVMVTEHGETPGLGTQATDRKVRKSLWRDSPLAAGEVPPNGFLDGAFGDKPVGEFSLDKPSRAGEPMSIEAVSGATFSSRGVHEAVNKACRLYNENKTRLTVASEKADSGRE